MDVPGSLQRSRFSVPFLPMDVRITLPILLLAIAVTLTGAVDAALTPERRGFTLETAGSGSTPLALLTMTGPLGQSPALSWGEPPPGTRELILVGTDFDAPPQARLFWLERAINPSTRSLEAGRPGFRALGLEAWSHHHWELQLIALAEPFGAASAVDDQEFVRRLSDSEIAVARLHSPSGNDSSGR